MRAHTHTHNSLTMMCIRALVISGHTATNTSKEKGHHSWFWPGLRHPWISNNGEALTVPFKKRITWACPEYGLAFPEPNPEKFQRHPENALRAKSEFPGFVRLGTPKPWKINHIPSPELFQNCATPSKVGTVSFIWWGPLRGITASFWQLSTAH